MLSQIYVQGIRNVPFNDFVNTTQYGYRAVVVAFCLVSRLEREPRTVIHVKRAKMFDPMG